MTKQLTRQEVEAVVERFEKEKYSNYGERALYIGDVLEKIQNNEFFYSIEYEKGDAEELIMLWKPLGLSRSLQEIIEESGWIYKGQVDCCIDCHNDAPRCGEKCDEQILKSPEANALFNFLQEVV